MTDGEPLIVFQFGETGQVARELIRNAWRRNIILKVIGRKNADFSNPGSAANIVRKAKKCDAVLNAVAYTAVDKAENDRVAANLVNAEAVGQLAIACASRSVPLIHLSTDYVFDGDSDSPRKESDAVNPINFYGASKLAGENLVRDVTNRHVILRTSWVFSPYGSNFLKTMLRLGVERDALQIVSDQFGAPTSAADIAATIYEILWALRRSASPDLFGTFHYTGAGCISWFDFASAILDYGKGFYPIKAKPEPIESWQYRTPATRPRNSALDCGKIEEIYGIRQVPWKVGMQDVIHRLATNEAAQ